MGTSLPMVGIAMNEETFQVVLDAMCCMMFADGKASKREQAKVRDLLRQANCPWGDAEIDRRVREFFDRTRSSSLKTVLDETCERLKGHDKLSDKAVLTCLDRIAAADDDMREEERVIRRRIAGALRDSDSLLPSDERDPLAESGFPPAVSTLPSLPDGNDPLTSINASDDPLGLGAAEAFEDTGVDPPGVVSAPFTSAQRASKESEPQYSNNKSRKVPPLSQFLGVGMLLLLPLLALGAVSLVLLPTAETKPSMLKSRSSGTTRRSGGWVEHEYQYEVNGTEYRSRSSRRVEGGNISQGHAWQVLPQRAVYYSPLYPSWSTLSPQKVGQQAAIGGASMLAALVLGGLMVLGTFNTKVRIAVDRLFGHWGNVASKKLSKQFSNDE